MGNANVLQCVLFLACYSNFRGNQYESADEWRSLSPTEAATGAGDIYALLAYEQQMQAGNLLSLSRGTTF